MAKNRSTGSVASSRRRSRLRFLLLTFVVVVLAFGVTVVLVTKPFSSNDSSPDVAIAPEPSAVIAAPQVMPVSPDAPAPTAAGMSAALAGALGNPDLGRFTGTVSDALTGTVLLSVDPNAPMTPASTTKVLTAAAAMLALPEDHRMATRVVKGDVEGQVVLVGSGDPTLTAQPVGTPGFFDGGARISDLAEQVRRSGESVTSIAVDTSAYSGDPLATGWFPADIAGGYIAPIEPMMLDAARSNPREDESPRSATPALDVGRALATDLGLDPAIVSLGTADEGADQLATVQSAPLRQRLSQMLGFSDNVLAEAVGREVAAQTGRPASFAGATEAVVSVLIDAGFALDGVSLRDTGGLSVDNLIPARALGEVVGAAAHDDPDNAERNITLRAMLDYLPVAGATGTLADRYASGDRTGAGWVRAKTGTLSTASALAGYVVDSDGRVLTFALMSNDRPPEIGRPALDAVASALRLCGCT